MGFDNLSVLPSERAILVRLSLYFLNLSSGVDSFANGQSLTFKSLRSLTVLYVYMSLNVFRSSVVKNYLSHAHLLVELHSFD